MNRTAIMLSGLLVLPWLGCAESAIPDVADPLLSSPTSIPAGIYTGVLSGTNSLNVGGEVQISEFDFPMTIIIDGRGRILDGDGLPFRVGESYFLETGLVTLELQYSSITYSGSRAHMAASITASISTSNVRATLTGSHSATFSFDSRTGRLRMAQVQNYGGRSTAGLSINMRSEGEAILTSD